jgi:TRAP-type uncharacterized transport system substrate-binding protein
MDASNIRWVTAALVIGLVAFASYGVVRQSQAIGEGRIVMAAGSEQYYQLAETYRRDLERYGVRYEVQRDAEGFATLKALLKAGPGINAAFIKGGLVGSLQGRLATEKAKNRHEEFAKLWSIGRLFYEPIWVFTRGDLPISSLRDLKGKRVLTGTRESGTRRIASQLLKANGVDKTNTTLIKGSLPADARPLFDGGADAAILVEPPDSPLIQALLRVQNIRLMDFSAEAEAYDNRFPAIARVVLRKGAVEFNPVIPSADITLLATTVVLVVRKEMHPALVSLLTHTVIGNPRSGFDNAGDPVLFFRAGEFPSASDPEFQVPAEARTIYKTGELPILLRTLVPVSARLGLPFSFTAFVSSYGGQVLLVLIPIVALVIPFSRALPALYVWMVRRRLLYWYHQLKTLERSLDSRGSKLDETAHHAELERIDGAVRRIHVPLYFSSELYDLRLHIDLVRQRLSMLPSMELAAE